MSDDDDHYIHPQPPRGAIPIGPAQGRQRGVVSEDEPTRPPPPPTRTQRAQETRRVKEPELSEPPYDVKIDPAYYAQQDRHFVGAHPFDAALAALYKQREKLDAAIDALETLRTTP